METSEDVRSSVFLGGGQNFAKFQPEKYDFDLYKWPKFATCQRKKNPKLPDFNDKFQ
jgi:hypothetical protein